MPKDLKKLLNNTDGAMNKTELFSNIKKKKSFLCIGLDTDIDLIPKHLLKEEDPVFAFNRQIIDATIEYCVAYKPNLAFYESTGTKGWESLEKTISYLHQTVDRPFIIADAKRGDISNTSAMYAKAFFERLQVDAITVNPYMGSDAVQPFLEYEDKWAVLLILTSNKGANDFQYLPTENHVPLYKAVIKKSMEWGNDSNMMFVVGATQAEKLRTVREIAPRHFLLIPGIGTQGGDLKTVAGFALNDQCGILVNASRSIIYAGKDIDFDRKARIAAKTLQYEMQQILYLHKLL